MLAEGFLRPASISSNEAGEAQYSLTIGEKSLFLNDFLEKEIFLEFLGATRCVFCSKPTKKSFANGSCYKCFISLPQNDLCLLKPETCHFHKGTCRNSVWGEDHCFQKHFIYLSNTSGMKVGITRHFRLKTRWLEQGASAATTLASVSTRLQAGLVELHLKKHVSDKTNWRKMLSGTPDLKGFEEASREFRGKLLETFDFAKESHEPITHFKYPVVQYPSKITSYHLDKNPKVQDTLLGLKGQYLIFASGVLNLKKFAGYQIKLEIPNT